MRYQYVRLGLLTAAALLGLVTLTAVGAEEVRPEATARTPTPARPDRGERPRLAERPDAPMPMVRARPDGFLNETQRAALREAMEARREEFRALQEKIRQAEEALREAALRETFDEGAVRQKAEALGKLQAEQMVLRLKLFSAILPTLTPEQRERLKEMPPQALGMALMGPGPALRDGPCRLEARPERRTEAREGLARPPR